MSAAYDAIQALVSGKRAIWLYELTRDGVTTRLTSQAADYVDADSISWQGGGNGDPVTHTRIRQTSSIARAETELVFPQSSDVARAYLTDLSYSENSLIIYREFKGETPQARAVKFRGRVVGTKPMLTRLMLVAENRFTEFGRKGLSAVMQRPCRHALYHSKNGLGCGLNIAYFEQAATLTAISGNDLTVTFLESPIPADGRYSGGVLTWDGKRQFITRHSGSTLTLLAPMDGLAEGLATASPPGQLPITIAPGCNLTREVCDGTFDNLDNHGGFPWMLETPFDGKSLF